MLFTQSRKKIVLLIVAALMVMSLPLAVAAQTADTMTNGITAPADGATVSGAVAVTGYASDANFMKWQLDLLPGGDESAAAFLDLGEEQGVFTYTLNTVGLPNGEHALRLRIVRNDSNYTEYTTKFTIANGAATAPAATAAPAAAAAPAATATPAAVAAVAAEVTGNGFVAPREGATVSGVVEVRGNATSADFMKWQLDLLPGSDASAAAFLDLGEEQGVFTYTLDTTNLPQGEHSLRLRVVRGDSNYDEYFVKFTIGPATAAVAARATAAAPVAARATAAVTTTTTTTTTAVATPVAMTNGITAPADGATVSGTVAVTGYASDANFMKWQLDLLPGGDESAAAFLDLGEEQGVFTYTLNTVGLPNGEHALRLRIVRNDSNYTEYTSKFTIAN